MGFNVADLLALQGNIKQDAESYRDEFLLQYRHYKATLDIFSLKPSKESKEFGDLVMFIAQVSGRYPVETEHFSQELMGLLDVHYAILDPQLRRTLVQALILMRNRKQVAAPVLLPLFFRLFRVQDKQLRHLLFRHIVNDIKASNDKHRDEKLNRSLQSFLYGVLADDNEAAAKKSLAVLTELWRRHVWRDARTVNVIASAVFHKSSSVMLAVLKFLLGQDELMGDDDGSDDDGGALDPTEPRKTAPSSEDYYRAYHKGTKSSKKKKIKKLQRVMATVKKQGKRAAGAATQNASFAALHLLHDPQTFAEKLFSRLQSGTERFETRLSMMSVISRVVGVHKLMLLNFYPFLQKYIAPHQRDVAVVLAALIQSTHELVPPDTMQPVLRQLVDQFVHDRARPEVMTIGLRSVRELCLRCPLIMGPELLQDLAAYKKFRGDKEVGAAARALIHTFQELNPGLLAKKDRGRGADLTAQPGEYGSVQARERIEGAELLEAALAAKPAGEDGEEGTDSDLESLDSDDMESMDSDDDEESDEEKPASKARKPTAQKRKQPDSEEEEGEEGEEGSGAESGSEGEEGEGSDEEGSDGEDEDDDDEEEEDAPKAQRKRPKLAPQQDSLVQLKRKLAEAAARKAAAAADPAGAAGADGDDAPDGVPIEMSRFLSQEDFARMRKLRHRKVVEESMARHGLKSTSKKRKLAGEAEDEADEQMEMEDQRSKLNEMRVNPSSLMGKHKRRQDKAERMASIMAGREGREKFGASSSRKKHKTGGLSEREKQRKKAMPIAARLRQLSRRAEDTRKNHNPKHFKGHFRKK